MRVLSYFAFLLLYFGGCQSEQRESVRGAQDAGGDARRGDAGCLMAHTRTTDLVAEPALLMAQLANCRDDSGQCMASTFCTGTADDRVCDSSQLITAEAAICIAQESGTSEGLESPRAGLVYNYKYRRIIWTVTSCSVSFSC
jgi:hypothetical protein